MLPIVAWVLVVVFAGCSQKISSGHPASDPAASLVPPSSPSPPPSPCTGTVDDPIKLVDQIAQWTSLNQDAKAVACLPVLDRLTGKGIELLVYPDLVLAYERLGQEAKATELLERLDSLLADDKEMLPVVLWPAGRKLAVGVLGEAVTLAIGGPREGTSADGVDENVVSEIRAGHIDRGHLVSMARRKASSSSARKHYYTHRSQLTDSMVGWVGAEGLARQLATVMKGYGHYSERNLRTVLRKWNLSAAQVERVAWLVQRLPTSRDHLLVRRACTPQSIARQLRTVSSLLRSEKTRSAAVILAQRIERIAG